MWYMNDITGDDSRFNKGNGKYIIYPLDELFTVLSVRMNLEPDEETYYIIRVLIEATINKLTPLNEAEAFYLLENYFEDDNVIQNGVGIFIESNLSDFVIQFIQEELDGLNPVGWLETNQSEDMSMDYVFISA